MKLSDIMSSMQLSSYADIALLLFLGAFGAIVIHLFRNRNSDEWERYRHLPLDGADEHGIPRASARPTSTSHRARQS